MKNTTTTTKGHHHHHSFSHTERKGQLFPLHRSITNDSQSRTNSSPITRFVCKLLGLAVPSVRPKLKHKSISTTSITKSSVISSYQTQCTSLSAETVPNTAPKKKPTITIVTPNLPCTLSSTVMDWDQLNSKPCQENDETCSVSSACLTGSSTSTVNSSISSTSDDYHCTSTQSSAAVEALVIASLIPTKQVNREFDNMPAITLNGRKEESEPVMTENIAEMVRPYIPRRYRIAQKWNLLYSLDQHGISLATLYSLTRDHDGPCIMTIKDANEQIFGAYLSHTFTSQSHYYGTGECFLWKISSTRPKGCTGPKVKAYPWTGKNDYMILSNLEFLAVGGGDGQFGLWLNSDLDKGYSNTCPTFDNDSLSLNPEFQCIEMEVWGLDV